MILIGYHGTNTEIEAFDLNHLGSGQGQSRFPGIYFSENFEAAKNYSNLAVDKNGGEPRVYVAECLLEKPLDVRKGIKLFNSFGEILAFLKEYFPQWFDENGNLLPYKKDYVTSKYETYDGQYNLIKYVSEANDIPLIEVCLGLGFDSWVGDTEFVITSPQQVLSFMEVDHQLSPDEINQERLPADESLYTSERASAFETTSNQYIQASKKGRPYKTKPGNRFLRRVYIKMNGGNNVWFDIDMNRLFRKGSFAVKIPVVGETKEYIDIISFEDWLPKLKDDIARTGFTQLTVKRSLMEMLRFHNLKVHCTCPDWKYRFQYWATVNGEEEGDPETRPANKTNPRNDLGKLCKHLNFCLNNKVWGDKESRIIYNYMINLKRTQRRLFDKLIAPKLGLETQEEEEERLEAERLEREKPNQVNDQVEQELEDQVQEEQPIEQTEKPKEGAGDNQ